MKIIYAFLTLITPLVLISCAQVSVPDARNVSIPSPVSAEKRMDAVNERPDSVMYLPLGEDVLVPERVTGENLPQDIVGPFELRGETLAGALQLILADYDISIAFESEEGLTRKVTVANLKGRLDKVVNSVCSLADLYCSYEDGSLVIKDTQTFTVVLPPLANAEGGTEFISDVIQGLAAVIGGTGSTPVSDPTTRTIIYSATQRSAQNAANYFQRLRANTAMIVFETYIWEVSLDSGNSTGIDWEAAQDFGKFKTGITLDGSIARADFPNPVSIGLPQTLGATPADIIEFLSKFGAVKTISQPQITVLSGASAELRVADTQNYVSEFATTLSGDQTTTSVSTDSVNSGFTLSIGSSWNKSTVYANVDINLTNVDSLDRFPVPDGAGGSTDIQLPQVSERELATQIRVRPGDSVLIGGLVRERDNFDSSGPGFMEPVLPSSRTAKTSNLELVIMMRPRVVVYTSGKEVKMRQEKAAKSVVRPVRTEPVVSQEPVALKAAPVEAVPIESLPVKPVTAPPKPVLTLPPPTLPAPTKTNVNSNAQMNAPTISGSMPVNTLPPRTVTLSPAVPARRYAPAYNVPVPAPVMAPEPVQVYSRQNTTASSSVSPLSSEVYQNAKPLNVYEAYERSQSAYYGE